MAFFSALGVNFISLGFYLLLFGAVLFLLKRYAFGPIIATIDARQEKINQALDAAQSAASSVDENRLKAEASLREASTQAQEILRRAEKAAAEVAEQSRADARSQAEVIVEKARSEIERERKAAVAELRAQVVDLALLAAGKVIEANLDDERNRKLVLDTINQVELSA